MNIKESETVETKKSVAQLKDSLKSISAILNKHQKGSLYFGIGPDGKPVKNIFSEKLSGIFPKQYQVVLNLKFILQ
jgi:Putative DNA-binding domain